MSRVPHHRYLEVADAVKTGTVPVDPVAAALYTYIVDGEAPIDGVGYAYDLFQVDEHRAALDAFILSRISPQTITSILEIPADVVAYYSELFMDVSVFRNRLEVRTYASDYPGSPYAKEIVRTAVSVGVEYLRWAYGDNSMELDTRYVVRKTMTDAFYRGLAHKGNALTSGVAKEAQRWWGTAIRNAEILEKIDPRTSRAAFEELKIALERTDATYTPDTSPVPVEDILH